MRTRPDRGPSWDPDSARGALLGLAVGDALGATLEGKRCTAPPFPTHATGPQVDMEGKGPHRVQPGQGTDETQMASALAASVRLLGRYDPPDALSRYKAWAPRGRSVTPAAKAVLAAAHPLSPFDAALHRWLKEARAPAGSDALKRTVPLGVHFALDLSALLRAAIDDARLTDADPRSVLACVALDGAIAKAATTAGPVQADVLLRAAQDALMRGAPHLGRDMPEHIQDVQHAKQVLLEDLTAARADDPMLYGPDLHLNELPELVRVPFRFAFWAVAHAPDFETGLIDVINRGGASDTNGAIAGALLGARFGAATIPERWRLPVMESSRAEEGHTVADLLSLVRD